jgi:hypothetical protein
MYAFFMMDLQHRRTAIMDWYLSLCNCYIQRQLLLPKVVDRLLGGCIVTMLDDLLSASFV